MPPLGTEAFSTFPLLSLISPLKAAGEASLLSSHSLISCPVLSFFRELQSICWKLYVAFFSSSVFGKVWQHLMLWRRLQAHWSFDSSSPKLSDLRAAALLSLFAPWLHGVNQLSDAGSDNEPAPRTLCPLSSLSILSFSSWGCYVHVRGSCDLVWAAQPEPLEHVLTAPSWPVSQPVHQSASAPHWLWPADCQTWRSDEDTKPLSSIVPHTWSQTECCNESLGAYHKVRSKNPWSGIGSCWPVWISRCGFWV